MNRLKEYSSVVFTVVCCLSAMRVNADTDIGHVFGFASPGDSAAVCIWVPVDEGSAVGGIRWYNNDGASVFPAVLAVAGDPCEPEFLVAATEIGRNVAGVSEGWSEFYFSQSLASVSSGMYLIFQLPANQGFSHIGEGGGAGFGVSEGGGYECECYFTMNGWRWHPVLSDHRFAMEPIYDLAKAGDLFVLGRQGETLPTPIEGAEAPAWTRAFVAYPNPFNPCTTIDLEIDCPTRVDVRVYDVAGRLIRVLASNEYVHAGRSRFVWDGCDTGGRVVSSGVYFCELRSGVFNRVTRVVLMK